MTKTNTEAVEALTPDHEEQAWTWLEKLTTENKGEHPNDVAFSADEMVDAFMAGIQHRALSPTAKTEPSAAGLVEELRAHVEASDKQVETGQFGQECIAFGAWTWENRHRILTALSAPTRERELLAFLAAEIRAEEDCNTGRYDEWLNLIDNLLNEGSGQ